MLIVFIRAIILYALIIFSIRLMGKRQLGELQPSELVVTILISNIATLPIEEVNIPMAMGVIPILTLVCLDVIMSSLTLKFRPLRRVVSGSPKIIIADGIIDQKQLKALRYTIDDLMESLRGLNIFDLNEVQFAIVETTGKISVYQKSEYQPATVGMIKAETESADPPLLIIDNGRLIKTAIAKLGISQAWVENVLSENHITVNDVYVMSCDRSRKYSFVKKQNLGED